MKPDQYVENVRPDGTASYLEINPERPSRSSRGRGWEGIVVERERFLPFDNGEVVYDETLIGLIQTPRFRMLHSADGRGYEGSYREGDIVISPAGQPVRWRLDDEADALVLVIQPEFFQAVAQEITDVDPSKVHIVARSKTRDPFLQHIALTLMAEVEVGGLGEKLYVESLANLLAIHLLRHHSCLSNQVDLPRKGRLSGPRLGRAIDALHDHLETGISLAELAEAAGVSTSHFAAQFHQATGLSPHQYLIRCRVERATDLLQSTDRSLSLAQVAALAGFSDQSHMTRHFKRHCGITPAEYRRRVEERSKDCANVLEAPPASG